MFYHFIVALLYFNVFFVVQCEPLQNPTNILIRFLITFSVLFLLYLSRL